MPTPWPSVPQLDHRERLDVLAHLSGDFAPPSCPVNGRIARSLWCGTVGAGEPAEKAPVRQRGRTIREPCREVAQSEPGNHGRQQHGRHRAINDSAVRASAVENSLALCHRSSGFSACRRSIAARMSDGTRRHAPFRASGRPPRHRSPRGILSASPRVEYRSLRWSAARASARATCTPAVQRRQAGVGCSVSPVTQRCDTRDPEVGEQCLVLPQKDVPRLHVPVHDPGLMRALQCFEQLQPDAPHLPDRQPAPLGECLLRGIPRPRTP